jgi:parvulin-like peptidyl-prolyl isomerase
MPSITPYTTHKVGTDFNMQFKGTHIEYYTGIRGAQQTAEVLKKVLPFSDGKGTHIEYYTGIRGAQQTTEVLKKVLPFSDGNQHFFY